MMVLDLIKMILVMVITMVLLLLYRRRRRLDGTNVTGTNAKNVVVDAANAGDD